MVRFGLYDSLMGLAGIFQYAVRMEVLKSRCLRPFTSKDASGSDSRVRVGKRTAALAAVVMLAATGRSVESLPSLSIGDSSVAEGDTNTRQAVFVVSLSEPVQHVVEVNYRTVAGTATAGEDYVVQTNQLRFLPGDIFQTVQVSILGDALDEADESFRLELFNPRNAMLADAEGSGVIRDNDPPPVVSISNATVIEGNSGSTGAVLTIRLSTVSGREVTVACSTSNGTARAGADFTGISGQIVRVPPGQISAEIVISVKGDAEIEPDEMFLAHLSSPVNAVLGESVAQATVITDDLAPALVVAGYRVVAESIAPANGAVDPGETVTVNLALRNEGSTDTTNLVATLLTGDGIQSPSGPQSFGVLTAGGPQASRPFSFTAAMTNCGNVRAMLHGQDGATDLGNIPLAVAVGGGEEFMIHSLSASGSRVVEHWPLTGDDRGGIAVSGSRVFVVGDRHTAHFALNDLSGGIQLTNEIYDGLVSDLKTEAVYLLAHGDTPIRMPNPPWQDLPWQDIVISTLLRLDGNTGQRTGERIDLSVALTMGIGSGVFAGWGRIVLHNGIEVYDIDPTSGVVTERGPMPVPVRRRAESWAYWGVAEFLDGALHLVYVQDFKTIVRARVPDGKITTVSTFESPYLGDMTSITVSPRLGRWYFHYEDDSMFNQSVAPAGAFDLPPEFLGYADAFATTLCGNSPPAILRQPLARSVIEGKATTFSAVAASNRPLHYQWRFNGNNIPGATSAELTLSQVTSNKAGRYSVVVSNAFGAVTSTEATLTVIDPNSDLFDDFDPEIDTVQWLALKGTAVTPVLATNYGGSVSGSNSLWIGNSGDRFAATRPLNTSRGGTIRFHLRLADGSESHWQVGPLPNVGVVLEYSIDDGTHWTELGRYDDESFRNWKRVSLGIPAEAHGPSVQFRWRQLSHSGVGSAHWCLDDVFIGTTPTPPSVTIQAAEQLQIVPVGWAASFTALASGSSPFFYQWRFNGEDLAGETSAILSMANAMTNQSGTYSVIVTNAFGSVTSVVATLRVFEFTANEFQIVGLFTNNHRVIEHESITGDARGGIAASTTHVFYTGREQTGRFALADLSGGTGLGRVYPGLVSDLQTERIYSLGNGTNLIGLGLVTTLIELDGVTLQPTGLRVNLSQTILPLSGYGGIFAGFGRIVLWSSERTYEIRLPTGEVTDLGVVDLPAFVTSEDEHVIWGVAEYWGGAVSLVYARDSETIVRTRIPDGLTSVVANFIDLGEEMSCFTASLKQNRWYFHYTDDSQFGGHDQTIGYADAAFLYGLDFLTQSPRLKIQRLSGNSLELLLSNSDGTAVNPGWITNARVLTTTNIALPLDQWTEVPHSLATNGLLLLEGIVDAPQRFFHVTSADSTTLALRDGMAEPKYKLRVNDAALSQEMQRRGARLIGDYGAYQLLEATPRLAHEFGHRSQVTRCQQENVIELLGSSLDTAKAETRSMRKEVGGFKGKRLHLVQFAGPVKPEWYRELKQSGVKVVSYVPHNAYLVYGDEASLKDVQTRAKAVRHVQWEGECLPEFKIHPGAAQLAAAKALGGNEGELFAIQLIADEEANADTLRVIDGLKRAPILKQWRSLDYLNVIVRLPPERLAEIAARPDVVSIQPYVVPQKRDERQGQILAGNLVGDVPSGPGYLAWLANKGFTPEQFAASSFVVDVSDSGIDNGSTTPGHPGLYELGNNSLKSRVAYNRLLGWPNNGSTIGCDGHGTLNAHIVAGYSDANTFPHADAEGYHYGLGIAPFVRVGSSVVFDPHSGTNPDYAELQSRAYQDNARISCNSWGAVVRGLYTVDCQQYDALVRDAQPDNSPFPVPGNQEMVIVFAAGNSGPTAGTVGMPGSAKNVICVGASENVHSHSTARGGNNMAGGDGCGFGDSEADNANQMAWFSSRGPCADGRIKPDLVGPGTHVTGGVAQQSNPSAIGTALICFDGSSACTLPSSLFFPVGQKFYTTSSGTSHSCPAIGGGAALLRQYFINRNWRAPSPAMTKAWLMNSARYLTGVSAEDTLPSNHQGMGAMNLGTAFDELPRLHRDQLEVDRFTASGQVRTFARTVVDPARPLRVTLAWTDAPGSTIGNAYNNDLDLTVTVGGQIYRGNVFAGALSVPGGEPDPRNNVESVFLPAGVAGVITVTVTAANINSDGVPGNADPLDQDFALMVYNTAGDEIQVVAAGATMTAEQCAPTNGAIDPGETVTVALGLRNVGPADTTQLVGTLLPSGGIIAPSGPQNFGGLTMAGEAVSRPFTFTASGGCGGTITATMQLQDGTNDLETVSFALPMGVLATNFYVRTNPAAVTISAVDGAVSPHPSELTVSGAAGDISQVVVRVDGLSHTWPADLKMVLVGPQGQSAILMTEAGDGFAVSDLTLAFDDAASVTLPPEDGLASGTWQPVTPLSEFKNANPNGVWRLFVSDHYSSEDGGVIARGWSLALTTTHRVCCVNGASVDLAITQHDTPNPVALSNTVTYTLVVSNRGPATATAVTLLDELSAEAEFLSAHTSQGSCTQTTNGVRCELGALPAGAQASVQIQVRAVGGPYLTSLATISAAEPERDPSNDSAAVTTAVLVPSLSIVGSRVVEGNTGSRQAVFVVSLSEPSVQTVEVDYETAGETALAGIDFMRQSNRLRWLPGEMAQTIMVPISGDELDEEDESFRVQLFNPRNASLAESEATATVLDDDAPPLLSIGATSVIEGNSGTRNADFTISLSAVSGRPVNVTCATSNGTAYAGSDFAGIFSQAITLGPGQLSTNLAITVMSDTEVEPDETFWVYLFNPVNAVLGQSAGQGTIVTDELAPAIVVAGYRVVAESFSPANETVDPGETVTVSVALRNDGSVDATNLSVTLQADGGVQSPSSPQNYGALPIGGAQAFRPFSFTAGTTNCGYLRAWLQIHESGAALGTTAFTVAVGGGEEFMIHSLSASGSEIVELQPGGLGGVALSHDHVFIAGHRPSRHALDLSDGTRLDNSPPFEGLVNDLRSETVYLLGNGTTPIQPAIRPSGTTVNSLLEVDGSTGALTGKRIDLSSAIRLWSEPGFFAGWGRIVLHNGLNVYDIDTISGEVTNLGSMITPPHQPSPNLAYRGVAEFFDGAVHLVYVRDSNTIARTRVPDGSTAAIATFRHLSRMASITVSPRLGRWYFSYGGKAQFGGMSETLGYADALATPLCGNSPPLIVGQPLHRSVMMGGGTTFTVEVANRTPSHYQWRFNGNNIEGATTATMTLNGVSTNHAGRYSVLVSNAYGSVTSAEATLTVVDPASGLSDDFDPDIDLTQWSIFDGAVGDSIQAIDYADSMSRTNSLWFSHTGDRLATTRSVDTRAGGVIAFYLRMAKGSAATWETAELPAKGITLEYSVNAGTNWIEINRYTNSVFHHWTPVVEAIPFAARQASTKFRWRQLTHAASMEQDHWALDDVFIGPAERPPMIVIGPKKQTVAAGWRARFDVAAESSTALSYQWQFNGKSIVGATNASFVLNRLTNENAGLYSVFVSNMHGAVTSPTARLTVVDSTTSPGLFDDFDPDIDRTQWPVNWGVATNHAGSVSGGNSLWFGNYSRNVRSRPLLVPDGWVISFNLRMAQGTTPTWETLDLPTKGIVLEYHPDKDRPGWIEIGRYTNSSYFQWTNVTLRIPAEAQGPSVQFMWRQLIHNGSGSDHWALDDVFIGFAPVPSIQLHLAQVTPNSLDLLLGNSDGSPIMSNRLSRFQVLTTTDLSQPLNLWQPLEYPVELTNGLVRMRGVNMTNAPQRFFRAVEHE